MSLVTYRQFKGEIPLRESHLLPQGAAQLAINCQFAAGSLQAAKDGQEINEMSTDPIRGIYTETGLTFFTWPTEAYAFKTPVIEDAFDRVYFLVLADGIFKATLATGMDGDGGPPLDANSFRVGVPRPTAAPVLGLLDRNTLPDYPNATVSFDVWWEDNGASYEMATNVGFTTISAFRRYSVAKPSRPEDVPESANLAVRLRIMNSAEEIANIVVRPFSGSRVNVFPGTQEIKLVEGDNAEITITWGPEDTRSYVYVYENTWNEEGAASPPALISPTYVQDVAIQIGAGNFAGLRPLLRANIYRTFGSSQVYVQAATTGSGLNYIDVSRSPAATGSSLLSIDWDPPPTGLEGLVSLPNGCFAAYSANNLYLSEPYRPHAFPYIWTTPTVIRGICAAQQSLVVTTADGLYILSGQSPGTAQLVKMSTPQPGLSQRSMVNIDGGVAYASRDGFVLVDGASATMRASQKLFGRQEWRKDYKTIMDDNSMRFSFQDGYLVVSSHTQPVGFTLRFDEDEGSLSRHTQRMDSTFLLPIEDSLYYSVGRKLFRYQAGTSLIYDWWGRDEIFATPQVFGAGFLRADGPVTVMLYADGLKKFERLVQPGYFRMPDSMPKCLRLSVRLVGKFTVQEFAVAQTMGELKSG